MLVLQIRQQLEQVVEVNMLAKPGSGLVVGFKERTFDDQYSGLAHQVGPSESFEIHVTQVTNQRYFDGTSNALALFLELDNFRTRKAKLLIQQLFPAAINQITKGRCAMGYTKGLDQ